ncbi:hypothetical protein GOBAR_AA07161 [Gossypium barbadense]|uniref:Endonuclease/exonuclease/phosphatase domain-containing protein n=1 Tax=Gossypium barbadense TaxID=3634 RepID=A0A2P5YCU4_GOSBA|nr:hypothetical protein GOBAR_AA07161 [Gossypium barbadense]
MAERRLWWCGYELPAVDGPGTRSIFYRAVPCHYAILHSACCICFGPTEKISKLNTWLCCPIGKHGTTGAVVVQVRAPNCWWSGHLFNFLSCRAIMPYFIQLIACAEASGTIRNVGHPVVRFIGQHRHLGASKCRMKGCLVVNACGKSGGLVMMWKTGTKVEIKSFFGNHIDSFIHDKNDKPIRFTGFYGNADPNNRKSSWDMLKRTLIDNFREVIDELSLVDVKTDNGWFTWVNNREGTAMVKERLDHFFISASDVESFPFIETKVIRQSNSDHDAIVLDTMGQKPREKQRDPRLMFRYDMCWAKEAEAKNIIKNAWKMYTRDIMDKLEKVGHDLGAWKFKKYKMMSRQIDTIKSNISRIIDRPGEGIERLKDMYGHWRDNTKDICEAAREGDE